MSDKGRRQQTNNKKKIPVRKRGRGQPPSPQPKCVFYLIERDLECYEIEKYVF